MWIAWVAVLLQLSSSTIAAPSPTGSDDEGRMGTLEAAVAELSRSQQVFQNTMLQKMEALMGVCQAGGPGGPRTTPPSFSAPAGGPACAIERESLTPEDGPPPPGAFIPDCTNYGHYQPRQCHGSSGHCWCVNVLTGTEHPGTRRGPTEPQPTCIRREAMSYHIESLFTDTSHIGTPTADMAICHGEGKRNCRKIWLIQEVLDSLQPGVGQVQLLPDIVIYLTLSTPPTQTPDSKSYVFTIANSINGEEDGQAIITVGNTGSVFGSVNPDSGDVHYLLRSCGGTCNILAERDANHFNNYSD